MPERLIGRTLGKYRVETLLGSGGFAWVFAASDPDLGIQVALKVLKPQYAGDAEFEERFRREASTAARLKHPNIIKIYTVGSEEQCVYFAMDLYTQKLSQQIGVMGTLPESAVLKLGLDVSSALGFAHRQGVIHRDIKADNILFDDHGNAIVADFGIARAAANYAEQTGTNVIMGTPQFFAPEQARGQPIDARADIYSLGVTLFVAATGQLPFDGADWYEIATKHVQEPPPAPRSINPSISPDVERVILKCLEKDRENRYPTADLLYSELESIARRRATEGNAATIMISTPVTGRFHAIYATGSKKASGFQNFVAIVGSMVLAAVIYVLVENNAVTSLAPHRIIGAIVDGAASTIGTDPGRGNDPGGRNSTGGSASGRGVGTRAGWPVNIVAPDSAAILINGSPVGRGTMRTDTLAPGNYRVSAQLVVAADCKWGTASTVVVISAAAPPDTARLTPHFCGGLLLTVLKNGAPLDAQFRVRWPGGDLIYEGRSVVDPSSAVPIVLPAGSLMLFIESPGCAPYGPEELVIDADVPTRKTIPLIC